MYQTNEFDDVLAYGAMEEDVLDNYECVSLSCIGTEAVHDMCKDYITED